ncbi:signal peptidase I [Xylanibacter caecicola]|uniref:signal peptidase I n=1 Tax=Xylanibacter caecicola TaxID=2736294 RepID=UPI00258E7226|nr:signal peptidase I [Xylanibacter caecicola]
MRSLLTITAAVIAMLVFRALAFTVCAVEDCGIEPLLEHGDRVLVNRWSYGLRTGGGGIFGYERWIRQKPERGELLAFNSPMDTLHDIRERTVCAGYFDAGAGDTVIIDGNPMTVPGKCRPVKVEPWNIKLLCNTYRMHERRNAGITNGKLYVDGKETRYACFAQNYCWVSNHGDRRVPDSRYFGFVPENHIIGRIVMIAYSIDGKMTAGGKVREDRCMRILPRRHIMIYGKRKEMKDRDITSRRRTDLNFYEWMHEKRK